MLWEQVVLLSRGPWGWPLASWSCSLCDFPSMALGFPARPLPPSQKWADGLVEQISPPPGSKCARHRWTPVWLYWNCSKQEVFSKTISPGPS